MPSYYLDTSVHLERWTGSGEKRKEIYDLLKQASSLSTSTHAYREWKRVTEGTAAEIVNAFNANGSLDDVLVRMSQLQFRGPGQALRVLSMLVRGKKSLDETAQIAARRFLRYGSRKRFFNDVDTVRDGSECGLARNRVYRDEKSGELALVWRCRRSDSICIQDQVLSEHSGKERAAGEGLVESGRKSDREMGLIAIKASEEPAYGKGRNCWGVLGDVAIALECGEGETLLTTDRSFEAMAGKLGLTVLRLDPS